MTTTAYPLDNSPLSAEIERLEWQHHNLLLPLLGDVVPPVVLAKLQNLKEPAVADLGTGTGVWLVALAPALPPAARLDGFDIHTAKFRPPAARPPNVQLQFGDALASVESEREASYDLAHARLLFLALHQPADWRRVAAHAHALLRPGAWLVWEEIDLRTVAAEPPESATAQTLRLVIDRLLSERPEDEGGAWYPRDLDKLLLGTGFANVSITRYALADRRDDAALTASGQAAIGFVLAAYLQGVLATGGAVAGLDSDAAVAARMDTVRAELASGAATTTHSHVRVVARRV